MKPLRKLRQVYTGHVWANIHNCKSCWRCVDACPKQVIGKTGFLWHKHIIFKNPENCTGCKKCVKICPHGVFSEKILDVFKGAMEKKVSRWIWKITGIALFAICFSWTYEQLLRGNYKI